MTTLNMKLVAMFSGVIIMVVGYGIPGSVLFPIGALICGIMMLVIEFTEDRAD